MRNGLNSFTENLIRLTALERVHQLGETSDNENLLDKQLEITELVDQIILRANKAPAGIVEVVFGGRKTRKDADIETLLQTTICKISGPNVFDFTALKSPFRTVIVVDHMWSPNLKVYQSEYGLADSYLR